MAAATAGIGLLPGHAAIGALAPVLLVVFRAAQGLSVGGEAAGATAFVVEYAPDGRRGWYGSWLWSTLALGVAGGIGVAVLLARVFPRQVLEDRGWRLAFLVALPLGLVGLYLRLRLDETPRFRAVERADAIVRRPVAATLRAYPGRLLLGLAPVAAASLTFNLYFFYLPSYLAAALGIPLSRTLAAALVGLLVVAVVAPAFGRLSDRVGRRPLLVAGPSPCSWPSCRRSSSSAGRSRPAWSSGTSWWRCRWPAWSSSRRTWPSCSPPRSARPPWPSATGWEPRCSGARRRSWPPCWCGGPAARPPPPSTPPPSPSRPWRPGRPRSSRWTAPRSPRRSWPGPDPSGVHPFQAMRPGARAGSMGP
jgi:MFS family permease